MRSVPCKDCIASKCKHLIGYVCIYLHICTYIQRAPRPQEPTDELEEPAQPTYGNHQDADLRGAESSHAVQNVTELPLCTDSEQVMDDVSHDGRLGVHGNHIFLFCSIKYDVYDFRTFMKYDVYFTFQET